MLFVVPVLSTLGGGFTAIHGRRWLHHLLAVSVGVLVGAAFLDLLPEALSLGALAHVSFAQILSVTLGSFLLFSLMGMLLGVITGSEQPERRSRIIGRVGGALLILHSFRDGMAIGASYLASPVAGYAVALGVGAHDFADGFNTVLLTTRGQRPRRLDYLFLVADAFAPVAGGLAAVLYLSSLRSSAYLLAAAAGFFLQMAMVDLVPELRRTARGHKWTIPAVLAGAALIYAANLLLQRMH